MSSSMISLQSIKTGSRQLALAYAGCYVALYQQSGKAALCAKTGLKAQPGKIKPYFDELVIRGRKVQSDSLEKLQAIKIPAVITDTVGKARAKFSI